MAENNNLSEREIETLVLVAQGLSNKEIAQALYISINTVKVHLRNIFEKIQVASRTEATLYAIEQGIIPSPGPEPRYNAPDELIATPTRAWVRKNWWLGIPFGLAIIIGLTLLVLNQTIFPQPTPTPNTIQGVATVQRWAELAPMSIARASLAVAAVDNAIYAIGGDTAEGVTGLLERYDPQTDSWQTLKPKPIPASAISAAVIGGKIYVPGGKLADGNATNVLEVFDPQQNTWQLQAALPQAVYGYALTAFEGHLFVFGGTDGKAILDSVYIYDPSLDTWTEGQAMPTARAFSGAAEAGGRIYVIGGWDGKQSLTNNEAYLPGRDNNGQSAWSAAPPLPEAQQGFGLQGIGEIIFLVGKSASEQLTLLQYLPQNNLWTSSYEKPPIPMGNSVGVATIEGYFYIIGGNDENRGLLSSSLRYQAMFILAFPNLVN